MSARCTCEYTTSRMENPPASTINFTFVRLFRTCDAKSGGVSPPAAGRAASPLTYKKSPHNTPGE